MLPNESVAVDDADRRHCRVLIFSRAPASDAAFGFSSRVIRERQMAKRD
jgi:hypothetical protein